MLLGILIFWTAHKLSGNPLFYYFTCITLGVSTSIIILVYFFSKFLLRVNVIFVNSFHLHIFYNILYHFSKINMHAQFKGKLMYLMIATGWTMSFYLIQMLWENIQQIVVQYREWVAWYILLTSLISFVISYRFGPVTNTRTKKLIQWFLQVCKIIRLTEMNC